ncbi:D-alanyl-D-alaninecarboxypeptidase/ D-alanyl-D-alanine-endopeptidase [uncultured Paludibacter sp.]|uniref:D-alanyl-D-alaninecarboxypeptidase/ D-alanyl-D-alanine-endopeptidase n=1 Tax=uncultured Paludibacter sp. TaxID=497635 RepID=A0A653AJR8_9BACT|nr:D-alanyl-D-alaninecarboxypeptidase/ D-alanyl-D-alanine-endopeptidase [uncultured Paludibacter sp.]
MKKQVFSFFLLVFAISLSAQNPIDKFVNSDLLKNANVSLMVKDLASGKILYEYRAENATIPASTMKTVTTSTALELLGGNYQFKTTLEYDGKIDKAGVLNGNLYIKGSGDPTLGSSKLGDTLFLHRWVEEVKHIGIKKIVGNMIADNSRYDDEGVSPHWTWEDIGNYYAAGAYGISYKDNTYIIQFNSKAIGTTPEIVKITPNIPELRFTNHLKSSAIKYDSAYIYGAPRSNERSIYGEIPANRPQFFVKGDIPRPGLLLAQDFKKELLKNKIEINGTVKEIFWKTNTPRKAFYTHFSPELRDIVKEINVQSNNHYVEHLFRHLSLLKDSVASSNNAVAVIKNYWKQKSLPVEQLFMVDGSGLSPEDAVSAKFYTDLLTQMNNSRNNIDFRNSLPIAGITGTAKSFLDKTPLEGKVRAKSGTINRVRCYVGYIDTDSKKWAFAILVNNANGSARDVTNKMEEFLLNITQ